MESLAKLSSVRITPRKLSLVADEVRGKNINEALNFLKMSPRKRTAGTLACLIKSAVANADQKGAKDVDKLYVKTLLVSQGPTLKRFRPRANGSASRILKRTSHVTVTLAEREA
ncbi:MAG: 50S ribosomal protein L22 [Bdellovibrionaceae bacterium]|nr:50S ribosomal protein L22 [Pseudobdellovibrionaceae bacterium]